MLCFVLVKINFMALGFFILFALIFIALIAMYIYSLKLKRKTQMSTGKFSLDIKAALDKITNIETKLSFLRQTEERVKQEKAYAKNPDGRDLLLSKIYQHKASVLFKANRQKEAIKACSEILAVEPSHTQTYLNRGSLYGEIGKYEKAIEDFNQAELLDSRNPNIYNNRGWMYMHLKEYDKALSDLDHAILLEPTDIEYFNRANIFMELDEWKKALDDYQMSLSLHGESDSELHHLIASSIAEMERKLNNSEQNTTQINE
jgi:tetratricopeptide (TPR) repeat protein